MTSSSRDKILQNLNAALPQASALPELPATGPWQTFEDVQARFADVLKTVGGQFVSVATIADANLELQQLEAWKTAQVRCSAVSGVGDSTVDERMVEDPHDLENVDFAVVPGLFGVAENAAIWVTDEYVRHRVLYFIPQHIAIVVPSSAFVHNMHEAYAKIQPGQHNFAGFISGPSKTADIEQSLVIGAHGARSLTVIAVDQLTSPAE